MSILDTVLEKLTQRRAAIAAGFDGIVVAIADGREPVANQVAAALDAAGKTPDDLAAAVELLQRRRTLRSAIDAAQTAAKRVTEIDAAVGKIEAKRQAADEKFDGERLPLDCERERLAAVVAAANSARRELYDSCADSAILDRSAEIAKAIIDSIAKIQYLQNERARFSDAAVGLHAQAENTLKSDGTRVKAAEESEQYVAVCLKLDGQIAEAKQEHIALLQERDELDARRLEP